MRGRIVMLALAASALMLGQASAQTYYDPSSGNQYRVLPGLDGRGATVYGSNPNTGSTWRQTIQPDGSQYGTDSRGNSWRYDSQTGMYRNPGAGVMCMGEGLLRRCW